MGNREYYVAMKGHELNEKQKNALCEYVLKSILQAKLSPQKALGQLVFEEEAKAAAHEIESGKDIYYGFVNPHQDSLCHMYADILDILEENSEDNFTQIETFSLSG